MFWHYSWRKKFVFEILRICFFFSLFSFLLYVTFFFSFISCFLICLKILHFIPFMVYYILLKQNVKQNVSKMSSKHKANFNQNNLLSFKSHGSYFCYTLIGYKFAVSLFASVLLQLLLKQIRKQNPSKRISKSNNIFYTKYASQLINLLFCLSLS